MKVELRDSLFLLMLSFSV